jgi:hypothetical protein
MMEDVCVSERKRDGEVEEMRSVACGAHGEPARPRSEPDGINYLANYREIPFPAASLSRRCRLVPSVGLSKSIRVGVEL